MEKITQKDIETLSKPDWDGHGAIPIHPTVFRNVKKYIKLMKQKLPISKIDITPLPNGTFSIVYKILPTLLYSENQEYHIEIGRIRYSGYLKHSMSLPFSGKIKNLIKKLEEFMPNKFKPE